MYAFLDSHLFDLHQKKSPDLSSVSMAKLEEEDNLTLKIILSGLQLRQITLNRQQNQPNESKAADQTIWSKYESTNNGYDMTICINSLGALCNHGWKIKLSPRARSITQLPENTDQRNGTIVAIIGSYNRGKSFLLNKLCGISVPDGNSVRTEGVCITAGRNNYKNIVFLDTAGTDTPVAIDTMFDKKATEALLRELVVNLCSFLIIVVNRLRGTDQIYIEQVLKYHSKNQKGRRSIMVVHNFSDIETVEESNKTIKEEVVNIFKARQTAMQDKGKDLIYYQSKRGETNGCEPIEIRHFVLARDGSKAGKFWNDQSLKAIMNILQTHSDHQVTLDIVNQMIGFINDKLPQILKIKEANGAEGTDDLRKITQHSIHPCLVLANRKDLQDLGEQSADLEVSESLIYDDSGYFILVPNGEWRPRYNVYDYGEELCIIIELAGFGLGTCTTVVKEKSLIINGVRNVLPKKDTPPKVLQADIPMGSFMLKIAFPYQIDTKTKEWKRNEGLLVFTASKLSQSPIEETV